MRLIDADKAYEVLTDYYHHNTATQHMALREALDRVPSVNAQPVRHGKWLPDNDTFERMYHVCSLCKRATQIPRYVGGLMYDYCPNCGARMDEATR